MTPLERIYREVLTQVSGERRVVDALKSSPFARGGPGIHLFAVGKAALGMARGAASQLPVKGGGVVFPAPPDPAAPLPSDLPGLELLAGSHPLPDERSAAAGRRLLQQVRAVPPGEPVLFLISGGSSALAVGLAEGVELEDKRKSARILMSAGATIQELNAVRKHLSTLKGGQLGAQCPGSPRLALVLGDVVGGDLATVGSGPTVADPTTFEDCLEIVNRRRVSLPSRVVARLALGAAGRIPETPKPGDPRLAGLETRLIGSPETLLQAAGEQCRAGGWEPVSMEPYAGEVASVAAALTTAAASLQKGQALVAVGEAMVAPGAAVAGQGGRALHLCMLLARSLAGRDLSWLAAGSDGQDAMTPYAGAEADGASWARIAPSEGEARLSRYQSSALAEAIGRPIPAFSSGTNLTDLVLIARG